MIKLDTILNNLLTGRGKLSQIVRRIRRFYYGVFKKDYIQKNIAENRQGECHRCGACCKLIYQCPFLGEDIDQLPYCRIYGDLRPANCHNYPFDRIDSEIEMCGFKFKDENSKGNR
jgi:hypothetical protein